MRNLIPFIILILCLFSSCQPKEQEAQTTESSPVIPVEILMDKRLSMDELVSEISFTPLETSKNSLTPSDFSKMVIDAKRMYFFSDAHADSHQNPNSLIVFDRTGKHLYSFDKFGRGQGEFSQMEDFFALDSTFYIKGDLKLASFDATNGSFISERPTLSLITEMESNGEYFLMHGGLYPNNPSASFNVAMAAVNDQNHFIGFPELDKPKVNWIDRLYNSNNNLFYLDAIRNQVYQVVEDSLELKYDLSFGEYDYTEEELAKWEGVGHNKMPKVYGLINYHETNRFAFATIAIHQKPSGIILDQNLKKAKAFYIPFFLQENIFSHSILGHIKASYEDDFYGLLTYNDWKYFRESISSGKLEISEQLKTQFMDPAFDELDINSNPILVKMKLNKDLVK